MFWIRRNTLEAKLAKVMGFEYCTLFDTARNALKAVFAVTRGNQYEIPSNVCPALGQILPGAERVPVDSATGLARRVPVQLYGYRQEVPNAYLDLDPLMTGFSRKPFAEICIISFGPKKMLDAGGGAALLHNRYSYKGNFPEGLRWVIGHLLFSFEIELQIRREKINEWDALLGDSCVRIPVEQVMPWRVMRRIPGKRDEVVKAVRAAGYPVGTNYPPLPGVTDEGAIRWGKEVINFFPDSNAKAISEIIKRTLAQ